MALKVTRKLEELKRTEAKIRELQDKKQLLEKAIKREEDEEIVRVLRSLKMDHQELSDILEGIQSGKIGLEDLKSHGMNNAGKGGRYESK